MVIVCGAVGGNSDTITQAFWHDGFSSPGILDWISWHAFWHEGG